MLYGLILTVHIVVCFVLIAVILFQAGRGGGLSDAISSGAAQSIFGTRGAEYLTKATSVSAALFMMTSLSLAVLSAHQGRSLMAGMSHSSAQATKPASVPAATAQPPAANEAPTNGNAAPAAQ